MIVFDCLFEKLLLQDDVFDAGKSFPFIFLDDLRLAWSDIVCFVVLTVDSGSAESECVSTRNRANAQSNRARVCCCVVRL